MENLLYIIAIILIIVWALGYFVYSFGNLTHILLVIALIIIVIRLMQGKKLV
jgi:hypothetical protein